MLPYSYIAMDWFTIVISYLLVKVMEINGILLLMVGGIIYTAGTCFFNRDHIPYNDAAWHVLVLGGSICHFIAIYHYVISFA